MAPDEGLLAVKRATVIRNNFNHQDMVPHKFNKDRVLWIAKPIVHMQRQYQFTRNVDFLLANSPLSVKARDWRFLLNFKIQNSRLPIAFWLEVISHVAFP